jgi:hypothetical protein
MLKQNTMIISNIKKAVYFMIFLIIASSCTSVEESDLKYIEINGKIVNDFTNDPISNISFNLKTGLKHQNSENPSVWDWTEIFENIEITTDENGVFSTEIAYKDLSNSLIFFREDDNDYTRFVKGNLGKTIADINNNAPIVIKVRHWEDLVITVKNIDPYDENDRVNIYVRQTNTPLDMHIITEIVNNGVQNQQTAEGDDNGLRPLWIGSAVDSEIKVHIQNGSKYSIQTTVTKNGITTVTWSDEIETIDGILNEYEVNY